MKRAVDFLPLTRLLLGLMVFSVFVVIPRQATAQTTSVIRGTVLDTQGRVIVGAEITINGSMLVHEIKISSDITGSYRVSLCM